MLVMYDDTLLIEDLSTSLTASCVMPEKDRREGRRCLVINSGMFNRPTECSSSCRRSVAM